MSKKKNRNNNSAVQVSAPSQGSIRNMAVRSVRDLGQAAVDTNISGQRALSSAAISDILLGGGANLLNPQIQTRIDAFNRQLDPQMQRLYRTADAATIQISKLEAELANPNINPRRKTQIESKLLPAQRQKLQTSSTGIDRLTATQTALKDDLMSGQPTLTSLLEERFPEARQALNAAQPYLSRMGQLGPAGERLAGALGQGYQSGTVGYNAATTAQAARQADVAAGRLGDSLMGEAQRRVDLRGRLDAEATRDAIQSARQGFAARGLATGNAALGAELLNRDRYQRQRALEDLGFASGIQQQDLGRQFQNQSTQQQREMFNAGQANQVNLANAEAAMRAQIANEESRRLGNQMNVGMLGDAYRLQQGLNQEGLQGVMLGSQLAQQANPYRMAMDFYGGNRSDAGTQSITTAGGLANTWGQLNLAADTFNANSNLWQRYAPSPGGYGNMQSGVTGSRVGDAFLNTGLKLFSTAGETFLDSYMGRPSA